MLRWTGLTAALLLGLLASKAAAAPAPTGLDRAAIETLERNVAALPGPRPGPRQAPLAVRMRDMSVPAVSVAFIEGGRVKWARAYGVARAGSGRRVSPATPFQAGSLSKAVAAAGALRLVDRGRLSLDEDVNLRLRSWRVPAAAAEISSGRVTLRRLLSHTAGLTLGGYPGYSPGQAAPTLVQSLAGTKPAVTAPVRLFAVPGSRLAYSGGGYSVAQLLMTEAAGMDFPRLMDRILLRPAGMTRSGFNPPPGLRAGGHDSKGAPIAGGGRFYPEMAAAGLWTTPSDYGRFLIALQDSRAGRPRALLRPGSARAMTEPVLADYGLGVTVMERGGRAIVTHGGANEGFECRFVAFLDGSRQGLVIMTNGDNGGFLAAAIQRTLGEVYGWEETLGPPAPRAPES